ncbi:hypothetical protein CKM354_000785900 [Cercospora kikuchii]|uniref:F-box domain-containing protein n=1 Tax=Cercospora kikuchii TaxID=84275 RepID=A0A9P3CUP8_9PEZI|nr:uncharacterized protein CKM354_000785900 [Cercospora kikuchii]GIZ44668.1 hypothetical protein CKM354_000785900 [Cercospora kikuchii]
MAPASETEQAFEACDRFFSIPELVSIFLEHASTQVLLSCQRVCLSWNETISASQRLQENLFFSPTESDHDDIRINPVLSSHFSPILAPPPSPHEEDNENEAEVMSRLERGQMSSSSHLSLLPWAQNSSAFRRREASWRNMLVSQPPICRLDWWHEWVAASCVSVDPETGNWEVRSGSRGAVDVEHGWAHQDSNNVHVTIGMLWDLVEGRIARGCWASVMYFPLGKDLQPSAGGTLNANHDATATMREREWVQDQHSQLRGWTAAMPRVKIQTRQLWEEVPAEPVGCDMERQQWRVLPESERRDYAGDGFNALREDCSWEWQNGQRWSKSEAFAWSEIDGESSGNY